MEMVLDLKTQVAGVQEQVTVTGQSPLVERTSNKIGGTLSRKEIEEVPSNFRNFTALTQLIPGMTPEPGRLDVRGRTGRGQRHAVAAERLPDRRHVQQRRPPGRQPGHAGARRARQHRGIPGAVEPVQRRVRRRRRRDHQHGDARRHQQLQRPRLHLLPRRHVQRARPFPAADRGEARRSGRCSPASASAARSSGIARTSTSPSRRTTKTSPARSASRRRRRRWPRT